jgi:hypothetical protein
MRFTRFAPLAPLALIAACVPRAQPPAPPPPAPAPAPAPAPTPAPTPAPAPARTDWEDAPQTPGDWTYANGAAAFGLPGQPRLTMTCAGGAVRIAVPGAAAGLLTVRTETATRAVQATGGIAALQARDPLLDAMAFSKGRFAIEGGGQALYVPAWPEISRVIEDCR